MPCSAAPRHVHHGRRVHRAIRAAYLRGRRDERVAKCLRAMGKASFERWCRVAGLGAS